MAIDTSLKAFMGSMSKKIQTSHQVTASIFFYLRNGVQKIQDRDRSALFAQFLEEFNKTKPRSPYHAKEAVPPHLYDVFGLFAPSGQIGHSAIVVDVQPTVTLAEFTLRRELDLTPLESFLENRSVFTPYIFHFKEINAQLPRYLAIWRIK